MSLIENFMVYAIVLLTRCIGKRPPKMCDFWFLANVNAVDHDQ